MEMFEEMEAVLGIDTDDPKRQLASELVKEDRDLIEALISLRLHKHLSQKAIADEFGRHRSAVCNFERLGADPHMSTVRRYAAAVGARVRHIIEDVEEPGVQHTSAHGWVPVLTDTLEVSGAEAEVSGADTPLQLPVYSWTSSVHTIVEGIEVVADRAPQNEGRHRRLADHPDMSMASTCHE